MAQSLLLTSATLTDGRVVDIKIENGVVTHIELSPSQLVADEQHSLVGYVIANSFVEPHAHLDKAFLADRISNPAGDLMGAIHGLDAVRGSITHSDIVDRATRAAHLMSLNGVTSVRTHADTTVTAQLQNVLALIETKQKCSSFINVQVAMLLEWPLSGEGSADRHALAKDAINAGIDVVGGCPHLDSNPRAAIDYLLELAIHNNLPLDLHADENLRPDSIDLEYLAETMIKQNVTHQVNASHCVSLSIREAGDIRRISEKVAEAGITVTALPQTNLFLQGRGQISHMPRAIVPIAELQSAGVCVAAGADNLQDPFNPVGRADPLEISSLLVTAAHLNTNSAFNMVTSSAHHVVHGHPSSITVGSAANLVAMKATNVRESIAMGPPDRFVVYGGVVLTEQIRNRK